jgi:hypothetical protein
VHVSAERLQDDRVVAPKPSETTTNTQTSSVANAAKSSETTGTASSFHPAQVCYLSPDIPGTLILEQAP